MQDIEGSLKIRLDINGETVDGVAIESTRPVHASRMFHQKPVDEVLSLLPLLFTICGVAQACAAAQACEQALGLPANPLSRARRLALVDMETLREHLWRLFLDWPEFLGGQAHKQVMAGIVSLQRKHRQILCGNENPFSLDVTLTGFDRASVDALYEPLKALLHNEVFAMPVAKWLQIEDRRSLADWAEATDTTAGSMIRQIQTTGWETAGSCEFLPLPPMPDEQIDLLLQDDSFIEQPVWEGLCRETGSLARNHSPLLNELLATCGNGLLTRLVARLTEIARLMDLLSPTDESGEGVYSIADGRGVGIGQVPAARGQLVHRVILDNDHVSRYQILAPTEWNFHPKGVVVQALSALEGSEAQIEEQARLLINAIDPCVGYELQLAGADHSADE